MGPGVKAQIARLHYVDGLSKQEIARRTGISRFKVARLLDAARAEGIVEIRIADPAGDGGAVARSLEMAFGLDLAVVAEGDDFDALGRAAADLLPELVGHGGTCRQLVRTGARHYRTRERRSAARAAVSPAGTASST
jgi:DNA-binding transcriptional regulator LsrR (DeoR family)